MLLSELIAIIFIVPLCASIVVAVLLLLIWAAKGKA